MKGVADRTLELMNEYQVDNKSWQSFQHFLVVKIETLEDVLKRASRFNVLSEIESAPAWTVKGTFQQEIDTLLKESER